MHNIKLENQVCSLELAKKLKKLKVKQKSLFYWINGEDYNVLRYYLILNGEERKKYLYSAFTVSELLRLMPTRTVIGNYEEGYTCWFDGVNNFKNKEFVNHNPANALALGLIYFLENKKS